MSAFRTSVILGALALTASLAAGATAMAQFGPRYQLPAGTYQQSCRNATVSGTTLRAQCLNTASREVSTQIDTNTCRGRDIMNDNGLLRCGGPVATPQPAPLPATTLPAGSYTQTCQGVILRGNILSAQCMRANRSLVSTTLDLTTCRTREVYNDQGFLRCVSGNTTPPRAPIPVGPYQQTCSNINLRGNTLSAQCSRPGRSSLSSSLDVTTCGRRDIINDAGVLACDDERGRGRAGRDDDFEVVVYTDRNYRGREARITESMADLAIRPLVNNQISSIRVISGRPEICTDPQYGGRCVTLDESVSDLRDLRMDENVSSIRGDRRGNGRGRGNGNGNGGYNDNNRRN